MDRRPLSHPEPPFPRSPFADCTPPPTIFPPRQKSCRRHDGNIIRTAPIYRVGLIARCRTIENTAGDDRDDVTDDSAAGIGAVHARMVRICDPLTADVDIGPNRTVITAAPDRDSGAYILPSPSVEWVLNDFSDLPSDGFCLSFDRVLPVSSSSRSRFLFWNME